MQSFHSYIDSRVDEAYPLNTNMPAPPPPPDVKMQATRYVEIKRQLQQAVDMSVKLHQGLAAYPSTDRNAMAMQLTVNQLNQLLLSLSRSLGN